jgi:hypothetical protein
MSGWAAFAFIVVITGFLAMLVWTGVIQIPTTASGTNKDKEKEKEKEAQTPPTSEDILVDATAQPTRGNAIGGSGGVDTAAEMCPAGTAVTHLIGKSGDFLDFLDIRCGYNGRKDPSNPVGIGSAEKGGATWKEDCSTGFQGFTARAGQYVDQIQPICAGETGAKHGGTGGVEKDLKCPTGTLLTGMKGTGGWYVDGMTVYCTPTKK